MNKYLKLMNQTTIECNKKQNIDCKNNEIVSKILEDEACFFKLNKADALKVLRVCGVSEDAAQQTYAEMTSFGAFRALVDAELVDVSDPQLKFAYDKSGNFVRKN